MSVAPAAPARLAGAAIGPLARAPRMLVEPQLAGLAVGHHARAGQVLTLVWLHPGTAGRKGQPGGERDEQRTSHCDLYIADSVRRKWLRAAARSGPATGR